MAATTRTATGAALYCRVSSRGQEQDGTSLDTQLDSCRRLALERGYTLAEEHTYREVHTGTELWERPQLTRLREVIRRREVRAVVVHAIDRLSRDPVHLGVVLSEADHVGVEVLFVTEPLDNSPEGQLIRFVRGYAGKVEHEKFRERAQRGKAARVASGRPLPGPRPLYGHRWVDDQKTKLQPDDGTAPVVQRIFAEYLSGRSLRTITRDLKHDGIPTPMGGAHWNASTLRYMLTNPAYTGRAEAWQFRYTRQAGGHYDRQLRAPEERTQLPEGVIQPLVDQVTFQAIQERLATNKADIAGRPLRDPEAALLKGMARCGYCGGKMRVQWRRAAGGKETAAYVCNFRDRHGCPESRITARKLDGEVWDTLVHRITHPETLSAELRHLADDDPTATDLAAVDLRLLDVGRRQQKQARTLSMLDEAKIDDPDATAPILAEMATLSRQKRQLQAERERLLNRQADWQKAQAQFAGLEAWCSEAAGRIAQADFARRRELLALLDVRIAVYQHDHAPRYVAEAWLPTYGDGASDPSWRRETMQMGEANIPHETVQMKVCIFQGWEDDDNPEIIATFYTDPDGNVHVDNEAFYDTVRGIVSGASGRRTDGHDGIAFLHAVRAYFPGPHIWAGEVVPLFPKDNGTVAGGE